MISHLRIPVAPKTDWKYCNTISFSNVPHSEWWQQCRNIGGWLIFENTVVIFPIFPNACLQICLHLKSHHLTSRPWDTLAHPILGSQAVMVTSEVLRITGGAVIMFDVWARIVAVLRSMEFAQHHPLNRNDILPPQPRKHQCILGDVVPEQHHILLLSDRQALFNSSYRPDSEWVGADANLVPWTVHY